MPRPGQEESWVKNTPDYSKEGKQAPPASAGSSSLLEELVREAMKIAMFDMPYDDDSVPEVASAKKDFRDSFRKILKKHRR